MTTEHTSNAIEELIADIRRKLDEISELLKPLRDPTDDEEKPSD